MQSNTFRILSNGLYRKIQVLKKKKWKDVQVPNIDPNIPSLWTLNYLGSETMMSSDRCKEYIYEMYGKTSEIERPWIQVY